MSGREEAARWPGLFQLLLLLLALIASLAICLRPVPEPRDAVPVPDHGVISWLRSPFGGKPGLLELSSPDNPGHSWRLICFERQLEDTGLPPPMPGDRWLFASGGLEIAGRTVPVHPEDPLPQMEARQGLSGRVTGFQRARLQLHECPRPMRARIEELRQWLVKGLARRLGEGTGRAGPWLKAMLLGLRQELDGDTRASMQATGLAHLLALSGLHVGLLLAALMLLLGLLPMDGRIRWLTLLLLLPGYIWLTGGSLSVIRAGLMAILLALGRLMNRRLGAMRLLVAAATIILLIWPEELASAGFQLSVLAVGALASMPQLAAAGFSDKVLAALGSSWRVQLMTAPVVFAHFQRFALAGMLLNLVAIPLASLLVMGGLLHLLLPLPGDPVGQVCDTLATSLALLAEKSPSPFIAWHPSGWQLLLLALAVLIVAIDRLRWRFRLSMAILILLTGGSLLPALQTNPAGLLFFNVGQGDACLLVSPSGESCLLDCGWSRPDRPAGSHRQLLAGLERYADGRLDWLVLSHPDQDHLGGAVDVLSALDVGRVFYNGEWKRNMSQRALQEELGELPLLEARPGLILQAEQDWRLRMLGPPPREGPCSFGNERSIVLRLDWGEQSVLLTADAGFEEEAWLFGWQEWLRADVLKLGHHGSRGSSSLPFMRAVGASEAWISASADNHYGHPHQEVLERTRELAMRVHRSDQNGWKIWPPGQQAIWLAHHSKPRLHI
jgi:competence protein ComEC